MNRRRALTIAGTVVATSATATLAIATNVGLLGFGRTDTSLGSLPARQPIELAAEEQAPPATAPEVIIRYEDVYVSGASAAGNEATTTTFAESSSSARDARHADDAEDDDEHELGDEDDD